MGTLRGNRTRRLKNDINVVPYIDVMLVLLVIFMVTAPMITPGQIELPSVGTASEVPLKPVEIQIDEQGEISMRLRDGGASFRHVDRQNLLSEVQTVAGPDTPVVISADGKVPYESVLQVMDQLRTGGVSRLGLLVNQTATEQKR
ncbi:MAG TPA: ExbD/TolR family protein [Castellaniella sp.]|nr:ExbD/TolR family protein [Castellaniella sp.]